jgi:purine-binding chemotaxis protein CheW
VKKKASSGKPAKPRASSRSRKVAEAPSEMSTAAEVGLAEAPSPAAATNMLAPLPAPPVAHEPPPATAPAQGSRPQPAASAAPAETPLDPLADFFVSKAEREQTEASFLAESPAAAQARSSRAMIELLAFWVADEEYALPIVDIQEIIKLTAITLVPRVHPSVLGIISLRGTIVPVIDLRQVLALERRPATRQSRILVLRADGDPLGLLVDRVTSVVRFEADSIEPTPRSMQRHASELLRGVGRIGQRFVIVLDVTAVLSVMDSAA